MAVDQHLAAAGVVEARDQIGDGGFARARRPDQRDGLARSGDEVDVLVKAMETSEGFPVLSRADAVRLRAWDDVEKAFNEGTPIKGKVMERIKGGLRVDVEGIAAFLGKRPPKFEGR